MKYIILQSGNQQKVKSAGDLGLDITQKYAVSKGVLTVTTEIKKNGNLIESLVEKMPKADIVKGLQGQIDIYDAESARLTTEKNKINAILDIG